MEKKIVFHSSLSIGPGKTTAECPSLGGRSGADDTADLKDGEGKINYRSRWPRDAAHASAWASVDVWLC